MHETCSSPAGLTPPLGIMLEMVPKNNKCAFKKNTKCETLKIPFSLTPPPPTLMKTFPNKNRVMGMTTV